jgi:hypothetical protein
MLGQDIVILLKLALHEGPRVLSKELANELFLAPSEMSKALNRCRDAGLLYMSDYEKRVNRSALLEFLAHGMRYVFPPERGSLTRGLPTGIAMEPLKSEFLKSDEPPFVWPYAEGSVRGLSFSPLYKGAPKAALQDRKLYELLALCDAVRGGRAREKALAVDHLRKTLHTNV